MISRKSIYTILGLALLALVHHGCSLTGFAPRGLKSGAWGVVTDDQGAPVAGARVYAYEMTISEGETAEGKLGIEDLISEELEVKPREKELSYDDQFRRPADYISALTDEEGRYLLTLPPGRYCLVARKRPADKPDVGPLTPEDYSSWISQPIDINQGEAVRLELHLRSLGSDPFFFSQYTVRLSNTQVMGKITDEAGQPLAGLLLVANRRLKISRKPDYASSPSGRDGSFSLYLPGGGIYYLELKGELLGRPIPCQIESAYVNPADNTIELSTGDTINEVEVIRVEENKGE